MSLKLYVVFVFAGGNPDTDTMISQEEREGINIGVASGTVLVTGGIVGAVVAIVRKTST